MSSPTQRSLKFYRESGYLAEVTEKWIPQTRKRKDLYGFGDILCISDTETLAVQATSAGNVSARLAKIKALESARCWLAGGRRLQIIGWKKYAKPINRQYWRPVIREVTLTDLD